MGNKNYTKDLLNTKNYNAAIGDFSYGVPTVFEWGEGAGLVIGKFCSIAEGVKIFLGGNHRVDWISTYPFNVLMESCSDSKSIVGHPATKGDVVIGHDVWIGYGVTILSGVTIGDGAVIGAHSVVSKNIEPYSVVVGNPCVQVKKRFSEEQIDALLEIQWWNWEEDMICQYARYLCSGNIDEFISLAYDKK